MAEITREHLELAALAAGHEIVCELDAILGRDVAGAACGAVLLRGVQNSWRPHLGDGDSRRLQIAVRATLSVCCDGRNIAEAWCFRPGPMIAAAVPHDGTTADMARAAREAVVLCAAAVGERMREGGA